jgi:LysM domain/Bacterial transcriptional activator domain
MTPHCNVLEHTVERGDTLWSIAERYYGTGEQFDRLIEANSGKRMPDGRTFLKAGLIYPGWVLDVPLPNATIEEHDGERWYVVQPRDTLSRIAGRVLGDENRYHELFELNVGAARVGDDGPILLDPNVIWPELRLRLPVPIVPAAPSVGVPEASPEPGPIEPAAPDIPKPATAVGPDSETAVDVPTLPAPTLATPSTEPATPVPQPTPMMLTEPPPDQAPPARQPSPEQAAVGTVGAVAAILTASTLVVRRRRPAPIPTAPESDVTVEGGFASADPIEGLARLVARTSDPPSAVASILSQAYAAVFAEVLSEDEHRQAMDGVALAATRHGRTSTTLMIVAPVAARPHLIRHMQAAVARAFGEHADTDGLVSRDGDVLVRVTWDPRHPVAGHVLDRVGADGPTAWSSPWLVPLMVLYDRQAFSVNWHALTNVLVAAPVGDGAEIVLTALVSALASARAPEDLGLVFIARAKSLPDELGLFPHGLLDPIDPTDVNALQAGLESVKVELDRRLTAASDDNPEIVVVIRELCDLEPPALTILGIIAATGPRHGVRLIIASERPVAELLRRCPFLDNFGTRLVRQTTDEDESVGLLGMEGAEELGSGGKVLLRLEGRVPVEGWARRVPTDHLSRLVRLMGTRTPHVKPELEEPFERIEASGEIAPPPMGDFEQAAPLADGETPPSSPQADAGASWSGSPILQQLRAAPLRVRCFGAREVWYRDRLLWPNGEAEADTSWELLLLLAVHRVTGVQSETLVDMLWGEETPKDPARALRQRRWRGREELRRLAPDIVGEPMPTDASRGTSQVYALNPAVVASDVHHFLELLDRARTLPPTDAIQAYEEALALYRGDLLDASDVPTYPWLYDGAEIALTLRSDYRRQHHDARLHLADLLGVGPVAGLPQAVTLYAGLCAEDPEDERLWTALFRIHERAEDILGFDNSVRRLRAALAELSPGDEDPEAIALPPNLDREVRRIRAAISRGAVSNA